MSWCQTVQLLADWRPLPADFKEEYIMLIWKTQDPVSLKSVHISHYQTCLYYQSFSSALSCVRWCSICHLSTFGQIIQPKLRAGECCWCWTFHLQAVDCGSLAALVLLYMLEDFKSINRFFSSYGQLLALMILATVSFSRICPAGTSMCTVGLLGHLPPSWSAAYICIRIYIYLYLYKKPVDISQPRKIHAR